MPPSTGQGLSRALSRTLRCAASAPTPRTGRSRANRPNPALTGTNFSARRSASSGS